MYFDAMYSSMPRITVNVSEETEAWLEAEADALGVSKARVGGHCIEVMQSTVDHINLQQSAVDSVATGDDVDEDIEDVRDRLDQLENRVDELEAEEPPQKDIADSGLSERREPDSATRQTPTEPDPSPDIDVGDTDPIGDALKGWSYGRTEEEQNANNTVARASLEWLRESGEAARQSDVPLEELAEDDPRDRTPDTLWRSVIRGAWQHAAGQGYVDMPDSRAYQWSDAVDDIVQGGLDDEGAD